VLMPGKDGVETLQEIKKIKPLTQVIMLTGNATVETAINGMKLGAYDYLMKPTDTEILVEKIDKACQLKQEHDERIQQAEINNIVKRKGW
ncbi:MAG: response regulator, partial [Deltaproteobacteria bacterium]|nr:response regulator [Deltaproteobacteria bacterium]